MFLVIPLEVLATSTIVYQQEFPNTCVRVNLQTNSLVLLVILSNLAIQKLANTNPFILFVEASPAQTPKTESYPQTHTYQQTGIQRRAWQGFGYTRWCFSYQKRQILDFKNMHYT